MEDTLKFDYKKGLEIVHPTHWMVKDWVFTENEHAEAMLANAMAVVGEKNGMSVNELTQIFPVFLRILKSEINWAK